MKNEYLGELVGGQRSDVAEHLTGEGFVELNHTNIWQLEVQLTQYLNRNKQLVISNRNNGKFVSTPIGIGTAPFSPIVIHCGRNRHFSYYITNKMEPNKLPNGTDK